MLRALSAVVALATVAVSTACGPSCQLTCERLYQASECNIQRAGRTEDELITNCMNECREALKQPGELGSYDPYEKTASGQSITLENEQQAAIWMDCVSETACENISTGMCAPVW